VAVAPWYSSIMQSILSVEHERLLLLLLVVATLVTTIQAERGINATVYGSGQLPLPHPR
jgi:hypothetical protein